MLSPRLADRDEIETYASGAQASVFKADGSGFIYYPSGRVAVYKGIIDERGRYYVYGDDSRSTPLGAVDEHAVGFVTGAGGVRLALNKVGGLLTDKQGYIEKEWRYDLGAHMPPPTGVLEIKLNRSLNFEFHDRGDMRIKFLHEGIKHELNAGLRPKREGSYLDHSIRLSGGRIEPQLERVSLVSRQQSFGNAMKAKRDRLKPRSRNLEGDCKDLVAGLEQGFDLMGPKVEPFPDPAWRKDAHAATVYELPRIRSTGLELGPTRGLGDTIYGDDDRDLGGQATRLSASRGGGGGMNTVGGETGGGGGGKGDAYAEMSRLRKDGKWLGELDVRRQLFADNPLLQRSTALQAASGRYGEEIVVPGGKVSVSNPTGKVTTSAATLRRVPASRLGIFLEEETAPDQLVAVVCVRGDDPMCNPVERAAELANSFLLRGSAVAGGVDDGGGSTSQAEWASATNPTGSGATSATAAPPQSSDSDKYQIVRVDFGEHQGTADRYGVKCLPAFLMFQGGRLAWSGTLGGRPVKAAPPDSVASGRRILLVESCAKAQIAAERTMRKFGCGWDLVITASQALSRLQSQVNTQNVVHICDHVLGGTGCLKAGVRFVNGSGWVSRTHAGDDKGGGYGVLMISDSMGAAEIIAIEKSFRGVGGQRDEHGRVIVGLATLQGDTYNLPKEALRVVSVGFSEASDSKRAVLSPQLALVADFVAMTPLRASTLKAIFGFCSRQASGGTAGEHRQGGKGSTVLGCSTLIGGDQRYKGVTPSRLLEKMEAVKGQAAMGIFVAPKGQEAAAAGAARGESKSHFPVGNSLKKSEIFVSAQETDYRGHILGKSALLNALRV